MEQAARVLERAPETRVALCHAGSPHDRTADGIRAWSRSLRALSALPHVSCKLSGLGMFDHDWTASSVRPIVQECLAQFGPSRCMFGSNFPVDSLSSSYSDLVARHRSLVPPEMHDDVFGLTARRFYRF